MDNNFSIDSLIKVSWDRYTSRIASVIFTSLFAFGIAIVSFLGLFAVGALVVIVILILKVPALYLLFIPMGAALWFAVMYVSVWIGLAQARLMTDHFKKNEIWKNFQEVMPLTASYLLVNVLMALFMLGLWYLFILIIPAIVWAVWATFSAFVYLDEKKGGLYPLWKSKSLMEGMFFPVFGRLAVAWLIAFGVMFVLNLNRYLTPLGIFVQLLFIQPFILAYSYEIYKKLKSKVKTASNPPKQTVWLILSAAGLVALVLFLFLIFSSLAPVLKEMNPNLFMNGLKNGSKMQKVPVDDRMNKYYPNRKAF